MVSACVFTEVAREWVRERAEGLVVPVPEDAQSGGAGGGGGAAVAAGDAADTVCAAVHSLTQLGVPGEVGAQQDAAAALWSVAEMLTGGAAEVGAAADAAAALQ